MKKKEVNITEALYTDWYTEEMLKSRGILPHELDEAKRLFIEKVTGLHILKGASGVYATVSGETIVHVSINTASIRPSHFYSKTAEEREILQNEYSKGGLKKAMIESSSIEKELSNGSKIVKLITRRHGVSENNPVWGVLAVDDNGDLLSDREVYGVVLTEENYNRDLPIRVRWANGCTNSYHPNDLQELSQEEIKIIVRKENIAKNKAKEKSKKIIDIVIYGEGEISGEGQLEIAKKTLGNEGLTFYGEIKIKDIKCYLFSRSGIDVVQEIQEMRINPSVLLYLDIDKIFEKSAKYINGYMSGSEIRHGSREEMHSTMLESNYAEGEIVKDVRAFSAEIECIYNPHIIKAQDDSEVSTFLSFLRGERGLGTVEYGLTKKSDGSVSGEGDTIEYTTMPLRGKNGEEWLKDVCKKLQKAHHVNKTCGLHIHLDMHDILTQGESVNPVDIATCRQTLPTEKESKAVSQIKSIVATYLILEKTIFSFVPATRRKNKYAISYKEAGERYEPMAKPRELSALRECTKMHQLFMFWHSVSSMTQVRELRRYHSSRYYWASLSPLEKYGTIEIRLHTPTLNATKILEWVNLHQKIIEYAKQRTMTQVITDIGQHNNKMARSGELQVLLQKLGLSKESIKYWKKRQKLFTTVSAVEDEAIPYNEGKLSEVRKKQYIKILNSRKDIAPEYLRKLKELIKKK